MPRTARPSTPEPAWLAALQPLIDRAQTGDRTALPELRRLLDDHPEIWQRCGDLAAHAAECLLTLAAGPDLFAQESIRRKLAELRTELATPSLSPLEKLLVDRILLCWLAVHHADLDQVRCREHDQGMTALSDHARKRLDSAHRRYLLAIKQLALVRKLVKPELSPLSLAAAAIPATCPGPRSRRAGAGSVLCHPVAS